jgi:sugar lactone lactonase YvrE
MIHVALGLGFEPDRKTMYHWDIVVNAPRQKLDIYGVDKNKKIHRILKKGEFVV